MKLLLKFRQYCMILTAVPGRFRPRGISVSENASEVAVKTIIVQEKNPSFYSPLFPKRKNLIYCFFPVYESEILTDLTVAKCRTTFEMGKKVKQLYHQRSRNLQKFFFRDFLLI